MKKHYSKIIAVAFALILCAVLFTACSNSGKTESSSSSGVEKATYANSKIDYNSNSSSNSDSSSLEKATYANSDIDYNSNSSSNSDSSSLEKATYANSDINYDIKGPSEVPEIPTATFSN